MVGSRVIWLAAALALTVLPPGPAQADAPPRFALADRDRVVFYGDSITAQRFYTNDVEDYVVTRYPGTSIRFFNAGWESDTVAGGYGGPIDLRLRRDVVALRPTVVTVMLGMNDGHRVASNAPMAKAFEAGYRHVLDTLHTEVPRARVTLLMPSPFDDTTRTPEYEGGYNPVLIGFGAFVSEQAHARSMPVCDMNLPMLHMLATARAFDPELAKKLIPDRIHPGPAAQWLMAAALLQTWGASQWVSRVAIAHETNGALSSKAIGAVVSDLVNHGAGLSWTELEEALPLPFDRADPATALVFRASNVAGVLGREPLVVAGLNEPHYALAIDGKQVGQYTNAELAAGIDLAGRSTPMVAQAFRVHDLTVAHQALRFGRWRNVLVGLAAWPSPARQESLEALEALDADLILRQRAAAKPKPHHFSLQPV